MASRYWRTATTPGDWTDATATWASTARGTANQAAPVSTNDVYLAETAIAPTSNVTGLTAITLNSLNIIGGDQGFKTGLAASGSALDIGTKALNVFGARGPIFFNGAVTNSGAGLVKIDGTLPGRLNGVVLGKAGSATIDGIEMSNGELEIGSSVTLTNNGAPTLRFLGGRTFCAAITWDATAASTVNIAGGAVVELQNWPTVSGSVINVSDGELIMYGTSSSALPTLNILGSKATVRFRGLTAPTSTVLRAGNLDLSDNPFDLSMTIEHFNGAVMDIRTKGTALTFTATARGRGAKIFGGTARSVSGLGPGGGSDGGGGLGA